MKKHITLTVLFSSLLTLCSCGVQPMKEPLMNIERGLQPAMAKFSEQEKQYITFVAQKLESHGFPVNNLTRIELQNPINHLNDYYAYNEVTFFNNPAIYQDGKYYPLVENIGLSWEEPRTEHHEDGSVEFQFGEKVNAEELTSFFYRLDDSYSNHPSHKDYDKIVKKVDHIFVEYKAEVEPRSGIKLSTGESISSFTSQGVYELLYNYQISMVERVENGRVYDVTISRLADNYIDNERYHALRDNCHLKVDTVNSTIEVIRCFDPTFLPSPANTPLTLPGILDDLDTL